MIVAVRGYANLEGLLIQRLSLLVASLAGVQDPQIVKRLRQLRMLGPELRFADFARPLVQRLGLGVAAEHPIQLGEIVAALSHVGMVLAERRLAHCQGFPIVPLGGDIEALGVEREGEVIEAGRAAGIALGQLPAQLQRIAKQPLGLGKAALVGSVHPGSADLGPIVVLTARRSSGREPQDDQAADVVARRSHRHAPSKVEHASVKHATSVKT
jgi:hypothetical protein